MKHIILAILFSLFIINVNGQAKYKIRYKINISANNAVCRSQHKMSIDFKFSPSGRNFNFFQQDFDNVNETRYSGFDLDITDNSLSFETKGENKSHRMKAGIITCSCCDGDNIGTTTNNYTDILNKYQQTHYVNYSYSVPNLNGSVEVSIYPANLAITDTTTHTILLQNEKITINATAGFPSDAYTWQYTVWDDPNYMTYYAESWSQITGYAPAHWEQNWYNIAESSSSISFTGNNILGNRFAEIVAKDKKLDIRLMAKDKDGYIMNYGSKTLYPMLNGPAISSFTAMPAKCNESTVTDLVVKFDRPIGAGRKLSVLFTKGESGTPTYLTDSDLNSNHEYIIKDMPVNTKYKFQEQIYYTDSGDNLNGRYYFSKDSVVIPSNAFVFPPKLQGSLMGSSINCHGGHDGIINAKAKGGTSPYTFMYATVSGTMLSKTSIKPNTNVTNEISDDNNGDLASGTYSLALWDVNGCIVNKSVTLNEPAASLSIASKTVTDASGYGLSNGLIQISLTGGTIGSTSAFQQGYPIPSLKDSLGKVYTGQFLSRQADVVTFKFPNLPFGKYSVRATDFFLNDRAATTRDSGGCLVKDIYKIYQPDPLLASLKQKSSIICFGEKTAKISSAAKGGVILTSGKPYLYQWSYSKNGFIAYADISTAKDSIISNSEAGFYKLTVTDKNNNQTSVIYQIKQPAQINYNLSLKNVTCSNWTDGSATVSNVKGGFKPYTVLWDNKYKTAKIDSLSIGTYSLKVSDSLNCSVTKSFAIKDTLNGIEIIQKRLKLPECHDYKDGELSIALKVDRPPYTLKWNTGSTDTLLTKLVAGDYTLQVFDSKNCLKEAVFKIPNPVGLPLWLGEDRYLCKGQKVDFDITVPDSNYTYQWFGQDEAKSPKISVTEAGRYVAQITNQKGCSTSQTINIYRVNQTVQSDFLIATQVFAGEEVSLVNITRPEYADTSYWEIDVSKIKVKDLRFEYATVVFPDTGVYEVGLRSQQDRCISLRTKQVKVLKASFEQKAYNGALSFIEQFEVKPNPSNGNFEVQVRLQDIASVRLKFIDMISKAVLYETQGNDAKEYLIPVHVQAAPSTYILLLETPYGSRVLKVVII